ncbi:hypothetical protein CCHOA_09980 [Corynebacterium choanae]|uniref:Uncharacterized protein n=1 Tax=Corynebacterium choanae TaxID=1862358 RepID=A0A3G6J900_9CORY|nr:hypothetical protein CCHOA_09980 [Corynebacterium choanae]
MVVLRGWEKWLGLTKYWFQCPFAGWVTVGKTGRWHGKKFVMPHQ